MKRYLLLTLYLALYFNAFSQHENIWTFGIHAGLDFNSGSPVPLKITASDTWEGCATISDENGELLFYSDGSTVYNKNHKIMPNGSNIQPYSGGGETGTYSTSQAALIVPVPRKANKYYIFSLVSQDMTSFHKDDAIGKLYYSMVDMTLDGGLGDIEIPQKSILVDSFLAEAMTSVKGNDCNVWVLVTSKDGYLKAYNVTEDGIAGKPIVSSISGMNRGNPEFNAYGCLDISPDGEQLAIAWQSTEKGKERVGSLGIYHFDINSGLATNEIILDDTLPYYSACFSPDGSKLYGSLSLLNNDVYQYDLAAGRIADIIQSRQKIYTSLYKTWGSALKRGPDGKVYYARSANYPTVSAGYLSVIEYPNLPGAACGFVDTGLALSYYTFAQRGLPNVVSIPENKNVRSEGTKEVKVCWQPEAVLAVRNEDSRNFEWNTGAKTSSVTVNASGTYWVKYRKSCDIFIDTFHVVIFNPVLETANTCINTNQGSARITMGTPYGGTYQTIWQNSNKDTLSVRDSINGLEEGNYSVHILSTNGCDTVIHFNIAPMDYRVSFSPSDTLICVDETISFANTSDPYYTNFHWNFGDGGELSSAHAENTFVKPGNYKVMLAGRGALCADTAYQTIIVDARYENLRFEKDKDDICIGEKIQFITKAADSSLLSFNWQFGDGYSLVTLEDDISHAYGSAGMMSVELIATSRVCPDVSFLDTVSVHSFPPVDLGADSLLCLKNSPIILQNAFPHQEGYRYKWNTGDTVAQLKVVHYGDYKLTVSNEFNCTATASIKIRKACYLDVPNAFSPDGDGINDYFFPRQLLSESLVYFRLQVFNRWGKLVFETDRIEGRGWDGRFNNREQPNGVYIYLIDAEFSNNHKLLLQGNVTLIR